MSKIQTLQLNQIEEVKQVILTVCEEIFEVTQEIICSHDNLKDIDEVESQYFNNSGTFLVIVDEGKIVGCGAIRGLEREICELKRLFLLKEYRGKGWGKQIVQSLLDLALDKGFKRVRLDTVDSNKQAAAIKFYNHLGFYFIERYNDSLATVFMEKIL